MLIILVSSDASVAQNLRGRVSLTLTINKHRFIEGENISLDALMENQTSETIVLNNPIIWLHGLHVEVWNALGQQIPSNFPIVDTFGPDTFHVRPYERIFNMIDMGGYNNDTLHKYEALHGRLLAGDYKILARIGDDLSDSVAIHVDLPSPEESEVARLIGTNLADPTDFARARGVGQELLRNYPHSVYLPDIYSLVLMDFNTLKTESEKQATRDEYLKIAREFLDKYSNSNFALNAIGYYLKGLKSKLGVRDEKSITSLQKQTIEEEMSTIRQRYSDSHVSRSIYFWTGK